MWLCCFFTLRLLLRLFFFRRVVFGYLIIQRREPYRAAVLSRYCYKAFPVFLKCVVRCIIALVDNRTFGVTEQLFKALFVFAGILNKLVGQYFCGFLCIRIFVYIYYTAKEGNSKMCDYAKIPLPIFQQRDFVLNIQAYLNVFPAVHTVLCGIGIQASHGILFCECKLSKFGILD